MRHFTLKNGLILSACLLLIMLLSNCSSGPGINTNVSTNPEGAAIKYKGRPIGTAPIDIEVGNVKDLLKITAIHESKEIIETRISFLSSTKARVTFRFDTEPSALARKLGLNKVLIFDYTENASFDTNQFDIKSNFEPLLIKQANLLMKHFAGVPIYICGHTDDTGSAEYNLSLSLKRAQAVADYLVSQKVEKKRLTIQGFGKDYPIADNQQKEGRAINRRTEILLPR